MEVVEQDDAVAVGLIEDASGGGGGPSRATRSSTRRWYTSRTESPARDTSALNDGLTQPWATSPRWSSPRYTPRNSTSRRRRSAGSGSSTTANSAPSCASTTCSRNASLLPKFEYSAPEVTWAEAASPSSPMPWNPFSFSACDAAARIGRPADRPGQLGAEQLQRGTRARPPARAGGQRRRHHDPDDQLVPPRGPTARRRACRTDRRAVSHGRRGCPRPGHPPAATPVPRPPLTGEDRPRTRARTMLLHGRPRPRRLVVARHRWLRGADSSSVARRIPEGIWVGPPSWSAGPRTRPRSPSAERTPPARSAARAPELPSSPHPLPDGPPNRGVMPRTQLTVDRHDRRTRAPTTPAVSPGLSGDAR